MTETIIERVEELIKMGLTEEVLKEFMINQSKAERVGDAMGETKDTTVHHPNHYTNGKFETIEVIEEIVKNYSDPHVGYCVGNTQKYIARAPFKHDSPLEDLKKARKYLDFAIDRLERLEAEDGANPEDFIFNGADVDGDEDTFVNLNEDDKSINECVRCDGYVTERELANGVNICVYCALRIVEEHLQ